MRDAQNATIRNNRFGDPPNARNFAIVASDSGRSSRPNLSSILIKDNILNGEIIKECGGPVTCLNNDSSTGGTTPTQDSDGVADSEDNCVEVANANQADLDGDGEGNRCDSDMDGDGVPNKDDADPRDPNVQ